MNLKDEYNEAFVEDLAKSLSAKASSFDANSFKKSIINEHWEAKELKDRIRHISHQINHHFDADFNEQAKVICEIAPMFKGLLGMQFPDFIQVYGLKNLSVSLKALEELTLLFSSEFAIRPFIEKYPAQSMKQINKWSRSSNHHHRRLASEGIRPRLPWAPPLKEFIKDPSPSLPILETLKNDDSEYVRKSVANHLNDISKDHPELTLKIANNWYGKSKKTDWIVKHGLRTLLKKGNKKALAIFGLDNSKNILIDNLTLSDTSIKIGEFIHFEFNVINESNQDRTIRLEYKIDYVKANGSSSGKIFQISEFSLKPNSVKPFKRKQWFKELSTRRHYLGKHKITLIVNGDKKKEISLELSN